MTARQTRSAGENALLRRYEYEGQWVVAADLGAAAEAITVDTVGDTAIVVIEGDVEPAESELDLPGTAENVSVTNGVITVEGER